MTQRKMNNFWKYVGIIGSISSIIGIGLAIYYFNLSKENREPFFIEDTIKSVLIDSSKVNNAPFKIFRINGEEINENVTSSTVYFWNQGRKPIKQQDILDSLIIELPVECEILKCDIIGESREICDFKLQQIHRNKVKLDFKIIEELDGFMAQIIYIGSPKAKVQFSGHIEGVKKINIVYKSNFILKLLLKTVVIWTISFFIIPIIFFLYSRYKGDTDSMKEIVLFTLSPQQLKSSQLFYLLLLISAFLISYSTIQKPSNTGDLIPKEIQVIK